MGDTRCEVHEAAGEEDQDELEEQYTEVDSFRSLLIFLPL